MKKPYHFDRDEIRHQYESAYKAQYAQALKAAENDEDRTLIEMQRALAGPTADFLVAFGDWQTDERDPVLRGVALGTILATIAANLGVNCPQAMRPFFERFFAVIEASGRGEVPENTASTVFRVNGKKGGNA